MANAISFEQIATFKDELAAKPASSALAKAVQNVGPRAATRATLGKNTMEPVFSVEITTGKVTDQKQSGRCWLFSELNTMRHFTSAKFGIKDLEFSQAFNAFYDRLEKSNLFLERVIATADQELTTWEVADLLSGPNTDGGQFSNAVALIAKYGIVPKSVMPETYNSSKTTEINGVLNRKLRKDAGELRAAFAAGATTAALEDQKQAQLSDIYRMIAYAYGTPTQTFDFEYRDKDNNYHLDQNLTPKSFYTKYVGWNLDDYVNLVSTPEPGKEYYKNYHLAAQDTVVEGRPVTFLNVPFAEFEQAAIAQLQAGETIWFGNDVGADAESQSGTLEGGLYDLNALFDTDFVMDKGTRFQTREAKVSHAMVLTGVDLVDGQPTKWKVENSWNETRGHNGYFVADEQWFQNYAYSATIKKEFLTDAMKAALNDTPVELPGWDPIA